MVSKAQWRTIAIVLAVVLLLASFMTGLTGIADNINPVGELREDYAAFKKNLDALRDNNKALKDGKAEYDEKKAAYDELFAAYNEKYAQYEAADRKYNEDVLSYNRQLIAYNVGKISSAAAARRAPYPPAALSSIPAGRLTIRARRPTISSPRQ